ncbi:MAG: ROK family transcriptional regulator [Rhodobacteraceae bacterium]|nr:ROK family transcriptional regulator [Paracoccaceae bacterium]
MTKKSDRDQIRRRNRKVILQALRRCGPQARIDLGQATALSPATVTAITSDLLDEGLIEGIDSEDTGVNLTRGRPRSLLQLCSNAAFVITVRISVNSIALALANFAGEKCRSKFVHFDSSTANAENFPPILLSAIETFMEEANLEKRQVREISVAAQGVVDLRTGEVVWSPAFAGRNIPIIAELRRSFDVNCLLSNDTNMITEALHWLEPDKYSGTFAVIMLDYGVGMGLHLNGELFAGEHGSAGELGHTNHMPGGALCRCGKQGCIEAYLGDYALIRAYKKMSESSDPKAILPDGATSEELFLSAENGNEHALKTLKDAGIVLGYAIARILAILDPSRVVLTGQSVRAYQFMEDGLYQGLNDALVENLTTKFQIDVMPWNADFIHRGLVAQAMERLDNRSPKSTQVEPTSANNDKLMEAPL